MQDRVMKWLMQESWSVRNETIPGCIWSVIATSIRQVSVNVRQLSGHSDSIIIFGAVSLEDELRQQMMNLPSDELKELLWDIRFQLLRLGVKFDGVTELPEEIQVIQYIFEDGLTKDNFVSRIDKIHDATMGVIWTLARKFAQPPPERSIGFTPTQ